MKPGDLILYGTFKWKQPKLGLILKDCGVKDNGMKRYQILLQTGKILFVHDKFLKLA